MIVKDAEQSGVKIIELTVHRDSRGFFVERFQEERFQQHGLPTRYVQDNHSRSTPGILRGLHYQSRPAQGKLVGVLRGTIWDVTVDLRPDSPTFGKSSGVELSDRNATLLWVPAGFAHGFCVMGDEPADVLYKVDTLYNPKTEGGIVWNDPELGIRWPHPSPIVSARDQALPTFSSYRANPVAWERSSR
jgi:dTDP-4-dehydrorhamnose 3,5-epimerase